MWMGLDMDRRSMEGLGGLADSAARRTPAHASRLSQRYRILRPGSRSDVERLIELEEWRTRREMECRD